MDWSFRENWDEYAWSREIRKDELRIAGYFRALKTCLDLPGEDEMIFKNLMNQPEMVPTGVSDPHRMLKSELEQFEDNAEWEEDRRENRRHNPFEASRRVENLAREWNLLAASSNTDEAFAAGLCVSCSLGKLLSRIYNFEETDDTEDCLSLRIGLLKRMLADLNEAVEVLSRSRSAVNITPEQFDDFLKTIAFVRESIIDKLNLLRNK